MRISVNLATKPYVELRPYFLRLRVAMVVLALVAVGLLVGTHLLQMRLDSAQAQMNALQARTNAAIDEKRNNERQMRQPGNAAVLERAHFLNGLFLRKSFSWTAVMMDLETVLPSGVMVTSIEPQIGSDGGVVIRLRVSGERDRAVQLVRNLERSKRFLAPRLTGEAQQAKETGANGAAPVAVNGVPPPVEFEILADYNPLPEGQAYPKVKPVADAESEGPKVKSAGGPSRKGEGVVLKPYSAAKGGAR